MHLYAESQRKNKELSDKYMATLKREEALLRKIFDMEIKLAQYKFRNDDE